ncbi:MAG: sigma 54-interacting transcriptional regulator [Bacteroidota bacterium]
MLEVEEKKWSTALDIIQVAIWEWQLPQKTILLSENFKSILALDVAKTVYSEKRFLVILRRFLLEGQYFTLIESLRRCQEERIAISLSFLIQLTYRNKKWIKLTAKPVDQQGRVAFIAGALQDITEQKLLQEQYQSLQFLLDEAPVSCFLVDPEGQLTYVNLAAQKKLGYSKQELLQTKITQLNVQYTPKIWQQVWQNIRTSTVYEENSIFQKKDRTIASVAIKAKYLHTAKIPMVCLYVTDISEDRQRKNYIAELEQTLKKFEFIEEQPFLKSSSRKIKATFASIITQNADYLKTLEAVQKGAETETTMLVWGETGTGKELLADAIHELSSRKAYPLIKVNCAALPDNLIESELFGYEKGAFTGADAQKVGRFELADSGTLFLDEVGELPYAVQSKLLRVLQDGTFERIGGVRTLRVNVRIIAATNQDLLQLVEKGQFRRDLYYRLSIFPVYNMPLQQRKSDIPLLAKSFLKEFAQKYQKPNLKLTKTQLAALVGYHYPGNVRELKSIIHRAVILSPADQFKLNKDFARAIAQPILNKTDFPTFDAVQKEHIVKALEKTNWRVSGEMGAAKLLGLNANTLDTKMRKLGIRRPR